MKCTNCNKDFKSFEWYKENIQIPLCDQCLIELLQAKKDFHKNIIDEIDKKIIDLRNKINKVAEINN